MLMSADEILKLADPWMAPISAEQPGGVKADDDDRYVIVLKEIEALQSPYELYPSRLWHVVDKGGELLQEKSKDLRIASYMAHVMHRKNGLPGLLTGTALLTAMIETYWFAMFPDVRRIKGRVNSLQWFIEKSEEQLARCRPTSSERETLQHLIVVTGRLQEQTRAKFGDAAPAIGRLRKRLEYLLYDIDGDPVEGRPDAPLAPSVGPPPQDVSEMTPWLRDVSAALIHAARTERTASRVQPIAYRLMRVGLYAHLHDAPPADPSGRSQLPPPPVSLRERIATFALEKDWKTLLEEAELTLPAHPFWLDLHRYSAVALANLGDLHMKARWEVARETLAVLRRMPALLSMEFNDGMPFADETTRQWVVSQALA